MFEAKTEQRLFSLQLVAFLHYSYRDTCYICVTDIAFSCTYWAKLKPLRSLFTYHESFTSNEEAIYSISVWAAFVNRR